MHSHNAKCRFDYLPCGKHSIAYKLGSKSHFFSVCVCSVLVGFWNLVYGHMHNPNPKLKFPSQIAAQTVGQQSQAVSNNSGMSISKIAL